jgi:inner membrane protein
MASAFGHAAAALAIGAVALPRGAPRRAWGLMVACAVLPDVDSIGYAMGIPYDHLVGHRGLTHSIAFAVAVAVMTTLLAFRGEGSRSMRLRIGACLLVATLSHGVLDAMTNGGRGVAFLSPFSRARYFLPWRPIVVSPISVTGFFSSWGLRVLASEALWIGVPSLALALAGLALRRRRVLDVRRGVA